MRINPMWIGKPEGRLAEELIKRNPKTAQTEVDRIISETREATYAAMNAIMSDTDTAYDDAWDAEFHRRLEVAIQGVKGEAQ